MYGANNKYTIVLQRIFCVIFLYCDLELKGFREELRNIKIHIFKLFTDYLVPNYLKSLKNHKKIFITFKLKRYLVIQSTLKLVFYNQC